MSFLGSGGENFSVCLSAPNLHLRDLQTGLRRYWEGPQKTLDLEGSVEASDQLSGPQMGLGFFFYENQEGCGGQNLRLEDRRMTSYCVCPLSRSRSRLTPCFTEKELFEAQGY